jgi:hypothetical protein
MKRRPDFRGLILNALCSRLYGTAVRFSLFLGPRTQNQSGRNASGLGNFAA